MLLFLMDVDFGCDWILIQIFYAHRFVGKDAGTCNQHSWHHTSHIQICKQLIVRWSTRAWFLYVWDLLQLSEMKTEHKSMFNSLPRSFNCLRTESADFCSLNGRTIRTDCRSGVDSVFNYLQYGIYITYKWQFLLYLHYDTDATCIAYVQYDLYSTYNTTLLGKRHTLEITYYEVYLSQLYTVWSTYNFCINIIATIFIAISLSHRILFSRKMRKSPSLGNSEWDRSIKPNWETLQIVLQRSFKNLEFWSRSQ